MVRSEQLGFSGLRLFSNRAATIVWVCVLLLIGAAYAYYRAFTTLMPYDDEGTLLISVHEFERGAPLYDEVYSRYGPFYYLFKHVIFGLLGAPISHDVTRLTTVSLWVASAAVIALFVFRLTRSMLAASVVYLQLVLFLVRFTYEPGHPHELGIFLISGLLLLSVDIDPNLPSIRRLVVIGAIVGALTLTKINLGVFLAMSVLLVFLRFSERGRMRTMMASILAVTTLALPIVLMRLHLHETGTFRYAVAVVSTLVALLAVTYRSAAKGKLSLPHFAAAALGGAVVAAGSALFVFSRGTSVYGLIDSILVQPLHYPVRFPRMGRLFLDGSALPVLYAAAIASALLVAFARMPSTKVARWTLGSMKLGFAAWVFYDANLQRGQFALLSSALPWLWLVVPRLESDERIGTTLPRATLCFVAALQALQAYPIAGSQVSWATFLLIPAAGVCLVDSWRLLAPIAVRRSRGFDLSWRREFVTLALFAVVGAFYWERVNLEGHRARYELNAPLNLPGSRRMRVPARQAGAYQWWVANLRAHCEGFVTVPGYPSLYLWTGLPPPTGDNSGAWAISFGDDVQARILSSLRSVDRPCVLRKLSGSMFYRPDSARGPLFEFMQRDLAPGLGGPGHELLVEEERAPLASYLAFRQSFHSEDGQFSTLLPGLLSQRTRLSVTAWIRTSGSGVILGYQSTPPGRPAVHLRPDQWCPILYVGTDGLLRGQFMNGTVAPMTSQERVDDGEWHHVALSATPLGQLLYVDGRMAGRRRGPLRSRLMFAQVGLGYAESWPHTNGDWFAFEGEVARIVLSDALTKDEILRDFWRGEAESTMHSNSRTVLSAVLRSG